MVSIGVVYMPSSPPERLLSVARAADEAGLDELWLWEDCFLHSGIASTAAALASTRRLRVAAGLLPVPLRNVALTAMELATLHSLFPGRVLTGVGHGVQEWMGQAGARVESPVTLLREYVTALRALLRGETVTVSGRYIRLDSVALRWPPSVPTEILVGAVGERTVRLAAQVGQGTMLVAGTTPEQVRQVRAQAPEGHVVSVNLNLVNGGAGVIERSAGPLAEAIAALAEAGADRVVLEPDPEDPDPEGFVRLVGREVAVRLGATQ